MYTKDIKDAIDSILEKQEMTEETRFALVELRDQINDDIDEKEKFDILIKFISIFKDVGQLAAIIKNIFQ